ncbi:3-oxoacyl-ACP synthase [Nocardia sp. 852002-20019_SCH5090214]|jgi:3-oxoacyl-[acyl-carrier-protein] synthase-3|uniref:3-oxoacyl-ACP synthase n=1 Tax=Nocardia nova TaxID=37330 RepID=A0A2S6AEN2_9NOCA|nr:MULTISPECIES: 3-oxoacyl-[acyl-carrier-protein] synthase III C-terminal domain-containing protein [Nocardia]OBF68289.1 3-oxoacyl-ACP synthase [Mycobacterium sp. 852002-51759_SCH5129042]MBF6272714.1 3-oxoacyl-ACP synthase [Nocardia nova]MBV7701400.1 3-oxoacyl-ACP synthase [Nocardia nova]OBA44972.1 3-oxoacyl-ACP synthase [Nocardia sp. 852002-51101_SCH5132738]OBA55636.1 3-oxoacyl-ACP synthase [Nocardia sp. 852002-20019_SCH5090214]
MDFTDPALRLAPVSLVDVACYLPGEPVGTEYFTQFSRSERMAKNVMFRAPHGRHHKGRDETAVDMVERAVAPLIDRHGAGTLADIDVLLTHTQLPDNPVMGAGPEVARRLGMNPKWVFDVHNGGCAAFIHMMMLARMILQTTDARTALIATTQNTAGPVFTQTEIRKLAQAPVPGDGCGVGLLVKDNSAPILDIECRTFPEFAGDMDFSTGSERKYWEPGEGQGCVSFTESKVTKVFARGNRLVPELALAVCDRIGVKGRDIDTFVTNQPNRLFLRNWHDALELPAERHPDSFDRCGNLFAAGIPVTLDIENRAGRLRNGSVVLLAAFAHAGDFAAAAAVRWGAA